MGKTSKNYTESLPSNTQSVINVNGKPIVESYIKDNTIYSNYYVSPEQEALNKYVQESLLESIPKIGTFLPETIENMNKEIEAYKDQGVSYINEMYTPMLQGLQNNIASRFGNLDNSLFMDDLNSLETKRSKAISGFAQDVQSKRSELVNDELQKQYNYINFLNNYQNQNLQNMFNTTKLNQSNLSMNNDYQSKIYNSLNSGGSSLNSGLLSFGNLIDKIPGINNLF